ncbi:MAG: GNAT family N-acetyltransferase [Eubacteriales bacterium]|nr:GNAT family N-acetyltransferase [Eubacteriales bacterium]
MLKFRSLTDDDIPLVERWLHQAHVERWYAIPRLGVTIDDWINEIKAYKQDFRWITYLIVLYEGRPIGLCLYYLCSDSKGEDFGSLPLSGAYGVDYLIGEASLLGRGLGKQMLSLLTDRIFSIPDARRITADIDTDNAASKNTLLSCGFTLLKGGRYVLEKRSPDSSVFLI